MIRAHTVFVKIFIIDRVQDLGHFVEIHLPMGASYGDVKRMSESFDVTYVIRSIN